MQKKRTKSWMQPSPYRWNHLGNVVNKNLQLDILRHDVNNSGKANPWSEIRLCCTALKICFTACFKKKHTDLFSITHGKLIRKKEIIEKLGTVHNLATIPPP
ncbi:hypothetical protein C0J52_20480 [Blattella germanica]|nr:hypothetical protein C0J52_20480 [Blattella germanica]